MRMNKGAGQEEDEAAAATHRIGDGGMKIRVRKPCAAVFILVGVYVGYF